MATFNAKMDFSEELRDVLEGHSKIQHWAKAELYTGIDPDDESADANNYYDHLENGGDLVRHLRDSLSRLDDSIQLRKLDLVS